MTATTVACSRLASQPSPSARLNSGLNASKAAFDISLARFFGSTRCRGDSSSAKKSDPAKQEHNEIDFATAVFNELNSRFINPEKQSVVSIKGFIAASGPGGIITNVAWRPVAMLTPKEELGT